MKPMPSVTAIIVSWNSAAIIGKTLESIHALDFPAEALHTVVVDNGSTDGTVRLVQERFPTVMVLAEATNHGFAKGNNLGMVACPADYFALINPDVELHPAWLRHALDPLERDPSVGVVGSKLYFGNRVLLQHAGGMLRDNLLTYHLGANELDIGQYAHPRDIDYATGAAFLTRGTLVEALGGLPEAYFMYYEETEFCYRARQRGWRVVYAPEAVGYHDERHSLSGAASWRYLWLYHRSRYLFALRNLTTAAERQRFLSAEQAWLRRLGRSVRYRLLLQRSKWTHRHLMRAVHWQF
jgi:GT2 family glycosyltransferase